MIGGDGTEAPRRGDQESSPQSTGADSIGIITVHDGPTIGLGEIIAPEVQARDGVDHHYFQDPEAFLTLGGRRGKQLQVLTDGTFFLNRWFATVEVRSKTLIPIGYVGVVVSYYGSKGEDVTGVGFRYGEQVEHNQRGVWRQALPPGKYAINPYALNTAYFRDVAQSSNMLDLLTKREEIQVRATQELGRRFREYDINCVAMMIGRPQSKKPSTEGPDPIERLFDQLRSRRLAEEQKATFVKQQEAATQLRQLNEANALAEKQTPLTQSRIDIDITANKAEAQLAEARRLAQREIECGHPG